MPRVTVRPLSKPSEFAEAETVQVSAWSIERESGVTPKEVLIAINDNGGLVLGAFDGGLMVGYALLFPGYSGKKLYMYSHQTGVLRGYQSKGVGYLLKDAQRRISLERGFDLIAWTFDPLIARNAHFNFAKLGTVSRTYLVDYYGPMRDPMNRGWPTDRFLAEWFIKPEDMRLVRSLSKGALRGAHQVVERKGEEPYPVCRDWRVDLTVRKALVDIPPDVVKMKEKHPDAATRWREATRDAFLRYFGAGFTAVALIEDERALKYLLVRGARLPRSGLAQKRSEESP